MIVRRCAFAQVCGPHHLGHPGAVVLGKFFLIKLCQRCIVGPIGYQFEQGFPSTFGINLPEKNVAIERLLNFRRYFLQNAKEGIRRAPICC